MGWIITILKAIPALRRLGELLERNIRRGTVNVRKEAKMDRVDEAIADALAHPNERMRVGEIGSDKRADEGASKRV